MVGTGVESKKKGDEQGRVGGGTLLRELKKVETEKASEIDGRWRNFFQKFASPRRNLWLVAKGQTTAREAWG